MIARQRAVYADPVSARTRATVPNQLIPQIQLEECELTVIPRVNNHSLALSWICWFHWQAGQIGSTG